MTGAIATKSSKNKVAGHGQWPAQGKTGLAHRAGPHADILAMQRAAGNRAISEVLPSGANTVPSPANAVPSSVQSVLDRGSGRPLPMGIRAIMEARFGKDFNRVRIHDDAIAASSARELDAAAYTIGTDIVFGPGRYALQTDQGQTLLAHELAHVVQQSRDMLNGQRQAQPDLLEHAADEAARNYSMEVSRSIRVEGSSPVRLALQRNPATFGNIPGDAPEPGARRFELVQEGGRWYTQGPKGQRFPARGTYAFAVQGGRIWVVKTSAVIGRNVGHTEAAKGGRAGFVGLVTFENKPGRRGVMREWTNASGHYRPVAAFAEAAGLPMEKFRQFKGGRSTEGPSAQLPVFQPETEATTPASKRGSDTPTSEPKPPAATASALGGKAAAVTEPKQPAAAPLGAKKSGAPPAAPKPAAGTPPSAKEGTESPRNAPKTGALPVNIDPAPHAEAIGWGSVLALQALHAVFSHFAEKEQRSRAEQALQAQWPDIQKALQETGQGVLIFLEYTQSRTLGEAAVSAPLKFEGLHWQVGARVQQAPGTVRGEGEKATFATRFVPPDKEAAARMRLDRGAAEGRLSELSHRLRIYREAGESYAREGTAGRFLRERKQEKMDLGPIYDARSHLTSARTALKQERIGDAQTSMDAAERLLDGMLQVFGEYTGQPL
jgi:hypothetical protein